MACSNFDRSGGFIGLFNSKFEWAIPMKMNLALEKVLYFGVYGGHL
jgi:hypothetical protein